MHPAIPSIVIINFFLYLNTFLIVTLFENFNLFHINGTFSKRTLFPTLGLFGLNSSEGTSFNVVFTAIYVDKTIHNNATKLPANEIEHLLVRSKAKAIVFSGKYRKIIEEIKSKLNTLQVLVDMDLENDDGDVHAFYNLVNKGNDLIKNGNKKYLEAEINAEEMAGLFFTSGTTDLAKGVMLSQSPKINLSHKNTRNTSLLPLNFAF